MVISVERGQLPRHRHVSCAPLFFWIHLIDSLLSRVRIELQGWDIPSPRGLGVDLIVLAFVANLGKYNSQKAIYAECQRE